MVNSAYSSGAESGLRGDLGINNALAEHFCRLKSSGHLDNFGRGTDILHKVLAILDTIKGYQTSL